MLFARFGVLALVLVTSVPAGALAQSGDDTRGLGDLGFVRLRPVSTGTRTARKKPAYRPAAKPAPPSPPAAAEGTLVGVTLWRLRPAAKSDGDAARLLVQEEDTKPEGEEWTPERVDLDTALAEGQHVRLAIETPRDGYLYVVDREIYADGSASPAVLIFPTTRTRGGDNKVSAGAVVEIPALSDDRTYFTVRRNRPDHVSEELTIVVAPAPLDGVTVTRNAQEVPADRFSAWRKQWGGPVERVDLVDGVGAVYTPAEKAGGASAGARLTQDDPPPQTIFRVAGHAGDPVLVSFPLKIR